MRMILPVMIAMLWTAACVRAESLRIPAAASRDIQLHVDGGNTAHLSLRCRADSGDSGFHHDLRIILNGVIVNGNRDRRTTRLINKPAERFDYPKYGSYAWCNTDEGWAVIRAKSFDQPVMNVFGDDPFHYVIDVTDMVHPGNNTLELINLLSRDRALDIVIDDVAITTDGPAAANSQPAVREPVGPDERWSVHRNANGDLLLSNGDACLVLSSRFTNVGGAMRATDSGWTNNVIAIDRKVTRDGAWLIIDDRMTAKHDVAGNIVDYRLRPVDGPFYQARVCGFPYPEVTDSTECGNPTLYGEVGGRAVGIVVEADVLRQQAVYRYQSDNGSLAIEDRRLVVSHDKSYTARLLIYLPVANDYFAFVAALRERWHVPTVESPLYAMAMYPDTYSDMTDDRLGQYFRESRVSAVITGTGLDLPDRPDVRSYLGLGFGRPELAERRAGLRALRDRIKRVAPQVKFLIKVHCYFNSPARPDDPQRYADCLMRAADGSLIAHPTWGQVYIPTLDNAFGRDWRTMIDHVADEIGADGFYWDESTQPGLPGEVAGWTYHMWDGVSADLDDTGRIIRKAGNISLITEPFRVSVVREQQAKGRVWCLGGEPRSAMFESMKVNWWRECQHHAYYAFVIPFSQAQAYTGSGTNIDYLRELLACGGMSCRIGAGQVSPYHQALFPFTLEQIGDGWLRGRDKLLTLRSGTYPWPHPDQTVRIMTLRDGSKPIERTAAVSSDGQIDIDVPSRTLVIVIPAEVKP